MTIVERPGALSWDDWKASAVGTMDSQKPRVQRKNVRYKADPKHFAQIDLRNESGNFEPELVALIFDESYRGCCLVILEHPGFEVGARCRIQVGPLDPLRAEVKWIRREGEGLMKLGFLFL